MLSTLIVNSYKILIEISLWLSLLLSIIGGLLIAALQASSMVFDSSTSVAVVVYSVAVSVFIWFVVAVVVFGTFLVLEDIRQRVKNIEISKSGFIPVD